MSVSTFADKQFIIHIDSHQRLSGTHEDGLYKINITNGQITDYDRVVVLSATIPKSYYAIEDGFNFFTLRENDIDEALITIEPGTYSATNFSDIIPELLNANSPNGWTYTIDFSFSTAKYTYNVSGNAGQNVEFVLNFKNIYEQLGFRREDANNIIFTDSITSTTVIDMSPENNIFLRSDICLGGNNNSNILQDLQGSGVPPFSQINYQSTNLEGYSKGLNRSSDVFRFYITNEDDEGEGQRILQLNEKNWTATILLYKRTTIPQMIKDIIKLNVR